MRRPGSLRACHADRWILERRGRRGSPAIPTTRTRGFVPEKLERAKGFEPSTLTLARLCSTPELHPHSKPRDRRSLGRAATRAYMPNRKADCNPKLGNDDTHRRYIAVGVCNWPASPAK